VARDKLAAAALEAEAEADRALIAFEREPTGQAHSDSAVATQRAVNARETLGRFERETLAPLVAEQQRELDAAEREVLARETDWSHAQTELERLESAASTCHEQLRTATNGLARFLLARLERQQRAQQLGLHIPHASYSRLLQEVASSLATTGGKDTSGNPAIMLLSSDQGHAQVLTLTVSIPVNVNRRVA
jgi:AraC-like DNA-binding protein